MMKKFTLLAFALGMICTVKAQNTVENYESNAEMQRQMQLIIHTLNLDTPMIFELGQIMEAKRLEKDEVLAEIDALKIQLQNIEANKEKEIQGILSEKQWAIYQSEIKPQTDKVVNDHMKTICE